MAKNVASVCCLVSLWCVSAGAVPVATTTLTTDLSKVEILINGENYNFSPLYDVPLMSQILEQSGSGSDASVLQLFEDGLSESSASATTLDGYAHAVSNAGSYGIFDVQDVSEITIKLDVNALIDLITESSGDYASALWVSSLGLAKADAGEYSPLVSYIYNSDQYDFFDGDDFSISDVQSLSVSYTFNEKFSGRLRFQSTLTADAYTDFVPPMNVPEPSGASLMVIGLAALLPLVRFRKAR